jgi:Uma2 family endonuclease
MPTTLDIPTQLVKEIIDEKPYYYKGYQKVLLGESTLESIMGSSELQSTLVSILNNYLWAQLDRKVYKITSGEPGFHLSPRSNFSNDLAIYRRADLAKERNVKEYFQVAPLVAIEVDIKIESGEDDFTYMLKKSTRMIEAGTSSVVWILTQLYSLVVYSRDVDGTVQPRVISWSKSHQILPGVSIQLTQWLEAEGETDLLNP